MTAGLVAPPLPQKAAALLRSIDTGAVLGASRQLDILGDALVDVAKVRAGDPEALTVDVTALLDYVTRTRGASSAAVANGLERMSRPLLVAPGRVDGDQERSEDLMESVRAFRQDLAGWLSSLRRHGQELLRKHQCVLAYDYSSTVSQVLADAARDGRNLTVFLPEARSLDGGRRYLADWSDLDVNVRLIPDAAMGWALSQCDAAFAGAETLSADGGCYNTIGTAVAAHEAGRTGVPFFVLSVLLKSDLRTPGGERPSPYVDFLERLETSVPAGAALSIHGGFPDLDYTEPAQITGLVTESGVIGPQQVRELATSAFGAREPRDG